ncbi:MULTISPECIES: HNH endonuclease signature motif containing protein [unclassified Coleofasciculus]|uniref:HNH endonuclease n=1 Tax=Cyanophyceae TaxID=3028117 RepID=UPI001684BC87|nr:MULTISPECIES: HNH endonuclease signature motif containing protein [unclassified Coleofasciculus]MBD1942403.1 HNH endonuclease [Coleofasciculus sp. FACHB-712]MBD1881791.1 HNH endonuclease [Coleofasciculus sp. FACHB-T130]MBD1892528.1 HNH endonuclease [Coleofasciculus sp. FACHB-SPT9]MBD1900664.1 HNH endonuclease [Coleofasciculus sp. FACHB-125]MBD2086619.1 HNH endonuclease [Coleofasciculus sp. FACHB-542]
MSFKDGDLLDTDHIIPKNRGSNDTPENLQLLHRHCHDVKTALRRLGSSASSVHDQPKIP